MNKIVFMKKVFIFFTLATICLVACTNGNTKSGNSHNDSAKALTAEEVYNQTINKVAMIISYKDGVPYTQGSGFFINKNTMVTNYHCVAGTEKLEFKIAGNEEVYQGAKVVKASPLHDLAIIKTRQDFPYVKIDSLGKEKVGAKIYAIGNPRGLEGTISDGILSGKRDNEGVEYLQITAPISPGNSGGPVLNEKGVVIGVATFTYKNSQNLNFAMPVSYINKCVDINSLPQQGHIVKSDSTAINIVSYSKGWHEDIQQISFHNNTSQSITSITGVLVYRRKIVEYEYKSTYSNPYTNWKYSLGDIFHYQVFSVDVDIAPKMSKLVNLRCDPELYVHQYCNSKSGCTGCGNTSSIHYDIEFRLLSYEIEE